MLIPRKEALTLYPAMPWIEYDPDLDEEDVHMPKGVDYFVLSSPSSTYPRAVAKLCREMLFVFQRLKLESFIILGAHDTPWRSRERRYADEKVKRIMKFLAESGIRPRFNGGISISLKEFPIWCKYVSYAVKANAIVSDIHFLDSSESLYFSPCQYGNLHLTLLNERLASGFKNAIGETELLFILPSECGIKANNRKEIPKPPSPYS